MKPILDVRGVNKTFGSVVAAKDVNVAIRSGERVGLIGTNGAGKTTFVNMVTGYVKPSSGAILLRGRDITGLSPRQITSAGVCRSFQIPQLFLSMTLEENLIAAIGVAMGYGSSLFRGPDKAIHATLDEMLSRFRIEEYRHAIVSELPGGVRKLVDIAVAVTRKPLILLLDEPTSGVASEQKFGLMNIMMEALDEDVTVLFIEHDMDIVERYADRVLAFYDGTIIADDAAQVVLENETVRTHITGVTI